MAVVPAEAELPDPDDADAAARLDDVLPPERVDDVDDVDDAPNEQAVSALTLTRAVATATARACRRVTARAIRSR